MAREKLKQKKDNTKVNSNKSNGGSVSQMIMNTPAMQQQANNQASMFGNNAPIQKEANNTGLPDNLKSGMENLSGMSLDSVKVHYNSSKPAAVQAHAFAQGTDIHLASGQEKHLPHELGHVVQQAQGKVKPTTSVGGVAVNDSPKLETQATQMGNRALQMKAKDSSLNTPKKSSNLQKQPIQMASIDGKKFKEYVQTGPWTDGENKTAIAAIDKETNTVEGILANDPKNPEEAMGRANKDIDTAKISVEKAKGKRDRLEAKKPFYDTMLIDLETDQMFLELALFNQTDEASLSDRFKKEKNTTGIDYTSMKKAGLMDMAGGVIKSDLFAAIKGVAMGIVAVVIGGTMFAAAVTTVIVFAIIQAIAKFLGGAIDIVKSILEYRGKTKAFEANEEYKESGLVTGLGIASTICGALSGFSVSDWSSLVLSIGKAITALVPIFETIKDTTAGKLFHLEKAIKVLTYVDVAINAINIGKSVGTIAGGATSDGWTTEQTETNKAGETVNKLNKDGKVLYQAGGIPSYIDTLTGSLSDGLDGSVAIVDGSKELYQYINRDTFKFQSKKEQAKAIESSDKSLKVIDEELKTANPQKSKMLKATKINLFKTKTEALKNKPSS